MDESVLGEGHTVTMTLRRVRDNSGGISMPSNNDSSREYAEDLIGRWEGVSIDFGFVEEFQRGELFWVFNADGTGVATEGPFTDSFTWWTEGRNFYMTEPQLGEPMHGTYSISSSTLTLRLTDDVMPVVWVFRRAN